MKSILILFLSSLILSMVACNEAEPEAYTRIVFNAEDLRFISYSANETSETMSLLYGNDPAYLSMENANDTTQVSEGIFKFVTWKFDDNPSYLGSKINGELLCVESIRVQDGAIDYSISKGTPMPVNGIQLNKEERVRYILGHSLSSLP